MTTRQVPPHRLTEIKADFKFPKRSVRGGLPASKEENRYRKLEDENDQLQLHLLAIAMGIHETKKMWQELALTLARLHYPNAEKSGRKEKWSTEIKKILIVEVDRLVNPTNQLSGVSWVCQKLARTEPWKNFMRKSKKPAEGLRKAYFETKKDEGFVKNAHDEYHVIKKIGTWESHVEYVVKQHSQN